LLRANEHFIMLASFHILRSMVSNQWTVPDFYPIHYIPRGVRLTAYGGGSADLPA
jgi:NADPH:quinone reductase